MNAPLLPGRIEHWPLARLRLYARNAKTHDADQVAKIAAGMAEFGWTVPCLVAADGELIAGHGRVLAAAQLGLSEAPVIVLGHLTDAQRRAYRIADNKLTELGGWDEALLLEELRGLIAEDFDLGLIGIPEDELDALLADADDRGPIDDDTADTIDVMRPSGRDFPLQPHFGVNRIATWSPSVTTTITTEGMPITSVGTVSHPTLAATNLAASMRRWRLTSAAVVDSVADQRSAGWACWRGNAAGLGGWTFVTRISLTTLQTTGMGFFGLYGSTAALATTLTLAAAINCIGIGFQRGTHTRWQLVANDGTGAPTLTDMGASFAIATSGVLTLFIAAPPNGGSVWVRVVDEVSGAVFEQEIAADLPAATQFLSPRLFLNTGATAAAVAYDCAGVYLETDF